MRKAVAMILNEKVSVTNFTFYYFVETQNLKSKEFMKPLNILMRFINLNWKPFCN